MARIIDLSSDVTGAVEIHRNSKESDDTESSSDGNRQSKWKRNKRKQRNVVQLFNVNWYKSNDISYVIEDFGRLTDNIELQLYNYFLMKK